MFGLAGEPGAGVAVELNMSSPVVTTEVPIRLVSEANQRDHWRVRNARKKSQQFVTSIMLSSIREKLVQVGGEWPLDIVLTRVGPRKMDKDNNAGSFKHVQDAIAKWFGFDDGDETKVRWHYEQAIGKPSTMHIAIRATHQQPVADGQGVGRG